MTPLVWFGPVATWHVKAATPPGYSLHVRGCVGNVDPKHHRCADLADRWLMPDGRRLPEMRRSLKLDPERRPFLAAYSAGGQAVRRVLVDKRDRDEIGGVALFDATHAAWASPGVVAVDALQEALVAFAVECAADGRPFVVTASSHVPGGGGPSGSHVLTRLWAEMRRAGLVFDGVAASSCLDGLSRALVTAERSGSVLLVDFGAAYTHGEHATVIPRVLLPRVVG